MARGYALHLSVEALEKRGVALGELTGEALGKVVVDSLNDVVDSAYDLSRKRMITGINLTDDYLRRRMPLVHATPAKPVASIAALGTTTQLSQFDSRQNTTDVNWSNAQIKAMGKKFSKWPGWTYRRGNAGLGIQENKKADGKSASVRRAGADRFQHAFSLAGKTDSSGNLLMFTRKKGGSSVRTLLGPAVYQLFKYQLNGTLLEETEQTLADTLADQVEAAMLKVLA